MSGLDTKNWRTRLKMELTRTNLPSFLKRFQNFHDAVLRKAEFVLRPARARVVLSAIEDQDGTTGWVNVTFEIDNVSKFRLLEGGKMSCVVLFELSVAHFNNSIYLDFCSAMGEPTTVEEFERSYFLVVGNQVKYSVTPYEDEHEIITF
jgi:hypothetical protein